MLARFNVQAMIADMHHSRSNDRLIQDLQRMPQEAIYNIVLVVKDSRTSHGYSGSRHAECDVLAIRDTHIRGRDWELQSDTQLSRNCRVYVQERHITLMSYDEAMNVVHTVGCDIGNTQLARKLDREAAGNRGMHQNPANVGHGRGIMQQIMEKAPYIPPYNNKDSSPAKPKEKDLDSVPTPRKRKTTIKFD